MKLDPKKRQYLKKTLDRYDPIVMDQDRIKLASILAEWRAEFLKEPGMTNADSVRILQLGKSEDIAMRLNPASKNFASLAALRESALHLLNHLDGESSVKSPKQ